MSTQIILRVLALRHRLRQRDRWMRRQLEDHQREALHRLREHAYARSPFYRRFHRELADRPLSEVPGVVSGTDLLPRPRQRRTRRGDRELAGNVV